MKNPFRNYLVWLIMGSVLIACQACQSPNTSNPSSEGSQMEGASTDAASTSANCWEKGPLSELDFLFTNSGFGAEVPASFVDHWMNSDGNELQGWFGRFLTTDRIKQFQPLVQLASQTDWATAKSVSQNSLEPIDLKCNLFEHRPQQNWVNQHWQFQPLIHPEIPPQDSITYFIAHPAEITSDFVAGNLLLDASDKTTISVFRSLRMHRFEPKNQWILFEVCYAFQYDKNGCFSQAAVWTHPVSHNTLDGTSPQEESLVLLKHFAPKERSEIQAWQIRSAAYPAEQGMETSVSFLSCHN